VSRLVGGVGAGMVPDGSFVPGEVFRDPCSSLTCSEISKQLTPLSTLHVFQTAPSVLYLHGAVCGAISLRAGTQFLLTLPALREWSQLIFFFLNSRF